MFGIINYGSYLPYFRLQRSSFAAGKGERTAANFDEDSVSMAVEAGREALNGTPGCDTIIFATLSPPYAEKLNGATLQAALDLPETVRTLDVGASSRMGLSAFLLGNQVAAGGATVLVVASDISVGAPGGPRESMGGDGAAAFMFGPGAAGATVLGNASATVELTDAWRLPSDPFPRQWEERFGSEILGPVAVQTAKRALESAGVAPSELNSVILDAVNPRAVAALPQSLGIDPTKVADPMLHNVGRTGTAHALLLLARALDDANPGDRILVVSAADGCEAAVIEVGDSIADIRPQRSVNDWLASGRNDLAYNHYLKWRGVLPFEPPRRPDPDRASAPPSRRSERWKMAFVGSECTNCGTIHLPPQRACISCGAVDTFEPRPLADTPCRVATYTLDYLAYSLNPPTVAAIVDFEPGGRTPCELTDVNPSDVEIGMELEMSFRKLYTSQGIHNYFWKARPRR